MVYKSADKNKSSKQAPAYQRIEEDIQSKVSDGRLPEGSMLASRHNLAREYGVALSTAQQAVSSLIAKGTLEAFDRKGTFVARQRSGQDGMKNKLPGNHSSLTRSLGEQNFEMSQIQESVPQTAAVKNAVTLGIVATARIDFGVSPDVGSVWARLAIRSLEQVFASAGGSISFFDRYPVSHGPYALGFGDANAISMSDSIKALVAEGADAIAVVGLCDGRDLSDEVVSAVDIEHIPTIYISWHEIPPPLPQVFYDNRYAGYQAAQHLLRKKYHHLVALAPFADGWLAERVDGMRSAIKHCGLPEDTLRVYPFEPAQAIYDLESCTDLTYHLVKELFIQGLLTDSDHQPIGIIAPNDHMAYTVIDAAAEFSKYPGIDFGLVGFDDDARSCSAGLTTVRPPVESMGEEAGRMLLKSLQGEKKGQQVRLRSHLIPRASTSRSRTLVEKGGHAKI